MPHPEFINSFGRRSVVSQVGVTETTERVTAGLFDPKLLVFPADFPKRWMETSPQDIRLPELLACP